MAPRVVLAHGHLVPVTPSAPRPWDFPEPFGTQDVVEVPLTEIILISAHLNVGEIHHYMNQAPLRDIGDPATPTPVATDDRGRSAQTFVLDVVVHDENQARRARVRGRDIYAVTAPIVVEAAERACEGIARCGTFALAQLCDASAFLHALDLRGELTFEALTASRATAGFPPSEESPRRRR